MEETFLGAEQREDRSTNTHLPKTQVGRFACPSSMLKDHPLENTGLLNAFVADASCFLRMFYAVVSQRFQKRASGSAVEPAWLRDRSPPCSVAGRGGRNVSARSWDFTARGRRESLLRGAGSTCLALPESFVFLSALQGSPEMADTEALGKDFTASML